MFDATALFQAIAAPGRTLYFLLTRGTFLLRTLSGLSSRNVMCLFLKIFDSQPTVSTRLLRHVERVNIPRVST